MSVKGVTSVIIGSAMIGAASSFKKEYGSTNNGLFEPKSLDAIVTRSKYKKTRDKVTHLRVSRDNLKEFKGLYYDQSPENFQIPEQIGLFSNLVTLELVGLKAKEIPSSIVNLTKLEKLDLQNNNLSEIPEFLSQMDKLWYLNLNRNNITKIQPERLDLNFKRGWNLKENEFSNAYGVIGLQSNNIEEIPEDYVDILGEKVNRILLDNNRELKETSEEKINSLLSKGMNPYILSNACRGTGYNYAFEWGIDRILKHRNDRLWQLSVGYAGSEVRINLNYEKYSRLKRISKSDFKDYQKKVLDALTVLSKMVNIRKLEISGPQYNDSPLLKFDVSQVFFNFKNLKEVRFKEFENLSNLDSLKSLTSIHIDKNILYNIEDLCNLRQLKSISLDNYCVFFPPCFSNLKNLKYLSVNYFLNIPKEFFKLTKLERFSFANSRRNKFEAERPSAVWIVKNALANGFNVDIAKHILRNTKEPTEPSELRRF